MTPPTTEQITALEQWARNWLDIDPNEEHAAAILALCETVRAMRSHLPGGCRVVSIGDACGCRICILEQERDTAHRQVISLSQDNAALQIERDAARAEVAHLQAALADARAVADMVSETARDRQ